MIASNEPRLMPSEGSVRAAGVKEIILSHVFDALT
jgi:hypothetical protein